MHFVKLQGSSEAIGVGKILCVGRNYAEHAKEMKSDIPESPIIFLKPSTAIVANGAKVLMPPISSELHHEVELTVLIGRDGKDIPRDTALTYVAGYGVGLDMTLRDVQADAKKRSLPWTLAKGFDTSAPLSEFIPASKVSNPNNLGLQLSVNGTVRQQSNTQHFIFKVEDLIAFISSVITLERGDVLFTGTPEGVGQVVSGDHLEAQISTPEGTPLARLFVSIQ